MEHTNPQVELDNGISTIEDDVRKYYVIPTKKAKLILGAVGIGALVVGYFSGVNHTNARWMLAMAKLLGEAN